MKRRWAYPLLIGGGAIGLVWLGLYLFLPRSPINKQNFDQIQLGMRLEEVERLLQHSPGDYTTRPVHADPENPQVEEPVCDLGRRMQLGQIVPVWSEEQGITKEWYGDDALVSILLDSQGRVIDKRFLRLKPAEDWFRRLRQRLGL